MKLYVPYASFGLVEHDLQKIADEINVALSYTITPVKKRIRNAAPGRAGIPHVEVDFKLRAKKGNDALRKFSNERRTVGICWHGHKMFMERLFRAFSDATLRTALAEYNGSDAFEELHYATNDQQWNNHSHCHCWSYVTDDEGLTCYLYDL